MSGLSIQANNQFFPRRSDYYIEIRCIIKWIMSIVYGPYTIQFTKLLYASTVYFLLFFL